MPSQPPADSPVNHSSNSPLSPALIVSLAVIVKLILALAVYLDGFRIPMKDELARWHMTKLWLAHPCFAPEDHVWLGGFFALNGAFMKVFGTSFVLCKLLPLSFSLLSIWGIYCLSSILSRSKTVAAVSTAIYVLGATHTWLSLSFMPGPYAICFCVWGLHFLFKGIYGENRAATLAGAALTGAATSFRYEFWFVAFGAGLVLLYFVARRRLSIPLFGSGIVLMGIYPVAWLFAGYLASGDPLMFVEGSQRTLSAIDANPLAFFWSEIRGDDPIVFLAGGAAFVVCLARGGEKHRLYCFVAALFGALFIYSNQYGAAAWLARVAQGLRAVLIPFIPLSVFLLVGHNPSRAIRKLCGAAAIVFILVYAGDQMGELAKGREWRLSSDILALGEWMRFEKNDPLSLRNLPENPTILFIGSENEDFYSRTAALYLSGAKEILYDMRYSGDPDIVIAKEMLPEPDYAERGAFGEWRVWLKEEKRK